MNRQGENPYPDASWSNTGTLVYKLQKWVYRKPIWNDCNIVDCLGAIKLRSDGRWSWWRFKSKHFPDWLDGQGVSLTKMGAIYKVYGGLSKPRELSRTHRWLRFTSTSRTVSILASSSTPTLECSRGPDTRTQMSSPGRGVPVVPPPWRRLYVKW